MSVLCVFERAHVFEGVERGNTSHVPHNYFNMYLVPHKANIGSL